VGVVCLFFGVGGSSRAQQGWTSCSPSQVLRRTAAGQQGWAAWGRRELGAAAGRQEWAMRDRRELGAAIGRQGRAAGEAEVGRQRSERGRRTGAQRRV